MTSADIITLIDVSGSMGSLQSKFEKGSYMRNYVDPLQQAADIAMAIKKRFPESKAYGFTNYFKNQFAQYCLKSKVVKEIKVNRESGGGY